MSVTVGVILLFIARQGIIARELLDFKTERVVAMALFWLILFFISGIILGAVFNVVGMYVPKHTSFSDEQSHCASCQSELAFRDLIPVISYILLRGRCRYCRARIPFLYPVIEGMTGLLFAYSYWEVGFSLELFIILLFVGMLMILFVTDSVYMIIPNKQLHAKMQQQLGLQGFGMLNTFGVIGLNTAYQHGRPWLDELMAYFKDNKEFATKALTEGTNHKIKVTDSQATYLLWLDCRGLSLDDKALQQFMIETAKVGLNAGSSYGKQGEQFMRLNFACPRSTLEEGVKRIVDAVNTL